MVSVLILDSGKYVHHHSYLQLKMTGSPISYLDINCDQNDIGLVPFGGLSMEIFLNFF